MDNVEFNDIEKACLETAREKIKQGWCQGTLARNAEGLAVGHYDLAAVCWCAQGAVLTSRQQWLPYDYRMSVVRKLERKLGGLRLWYWNDSPTRTKEEVLELLTP